MRVFLGPVLSTLSSFPNCLFCFGRNEMLRPVGTRNSSTTRRCIMVHSESLALREQQNRGEGFVVPHASVGVFADEECVTRLA